MTEHQLPPLPECDSYCTHKDLHDYEVWSAEQMREYALAAIALASPPVAVQEERDAWQPIATAPSNGEFLVFMPGERTMKVQAATWHPNAKIIGGCFSFDRSPVTHWMPLPKAPGDQP